jgi:tetratricopeptide (TPR) repeat protein
MHLRTFAGSCILHRAEVFCARGDIPAALRELSEGAEVLRRSAPWAEGDAHRVLGDLYLACGDFERCEEAYRQAHRHGWDPYPGYAMLQLYRGDADAALRGLQRACEPSHWVAGERRGLYLAHLAIIAAMAERTELAEQTLDALDAQPELWSAGAVQACVRRARGELAMARGEPDSAAAHFAPLVRALNALQMPIESALVRLRLARALGRQGDAGGAGLELAAARHVFEAAGAAWYLKMCDDTATDLAADAV